MMVSLYAMLDFVYMITGKIVWGLLVIGCKFSPNPASSKAT